MEDDIEVLITAFLNALSDMWRHTFGSNHKGPEILEKVSENKCIIMNRRDKSTLIAIGTKRPRDAVLKRLVLVHKQIEEEFDLTIQINNEGGYIELPKDRVHEIMNMHMLNLH